MKKSRSREFKKKSRVIDIEQARKERQERRAAARERETKKREDFGKMSTRGKTAIRKRRNRRRLVMAAFIFLTVLFAGVSVFKIVSLKVEQDQVRSRNADLKHEQKLLEKELENINDRENLEEQARGQLRLIKRGEIMYMFPDELLEDDDEKRDHNS